MDKKRLKEFVENNPKLVRMKASGEYPDLFVLKYNNKVFYKNLWTKELQEMRGLVIDHDWNIVAYPFTKIFNHNENGTTLPLDEEVVAVQKINGFMAAATLDPVHGLLISTTGTLDSDYAKLARRHLEDIDFGHGKTYIFEIVDASDPHIIPEEEGRYLLGVRDLSTYKMANEKTLDLMAEQHPNIKRPYWFTGTFETVLDRMKDCRHEGYVVYGQTDTLKLKSPYYLAKKFFARRNMDTLLKPNAKRYIDEEYYDLYDHITDNIEEFTKLNEQERLHYVEQYLVHQ